MSYYTFTERLHDANTKVAKAEAAVADANRKLVYARIEQNNALLAYRAALGQHVATNVANSC